MLKAENRLRSPADFRAIVRRGVRIAGPVMVVHILPPSGTGQLEPGARAAGLIVGRAVGGAVVRNRVRRRLRHLLRSRIDALPPGTRVVIRALPNAAHRTSEILAADFDATFSRALARSEKLAPAENRP